MGNLVDLTGKKFNHWTVLEFSQRKGSAYFWKCKCDCGTIRDVNSASLKRGNSNCCGCIRPLKKGYEKDLTGNKYGDFAVKEFYGVSHTHSIWTCECKCGSKINVLIKDLNNLTKCDKCLKYNFPFTLNKDEEIKQIDSSNYYISNYGNCFTFISRKNGNSKWIKNKIWINKGYLYVHLTLNHKDKKFAIHRLVSKYFCNDYKDNLVIDHLDSNKSNNYYKNLQCVTQKENVKRSYISSGINQIRNYKIYNIVYPDGNKSEDLKGLNEIKKYIEQNKLKCSALSLQKYGVSKDYKIIRRNKYEI